MNRDRVSFTVAVQIQQEAIAKHEPLRSVGLFRLLKTVIQGEASTPKGSLRRDCATRLMRSSTPSPVQQRELLRAHVNLVHPTIREFCRALRNGRCRRGVVRWAKRHFKCPECEARPMPRTRPAAALPKCYRFNEVCGIDTMEVQNPFDRENPIRISHVICHGTRYHHEARRQDITANETFVTLRQFRLKHYDAMKFLIMDQGTAFGAESQHLCQSRGILPVVTDLETPLQNSVVHRHGALFKMAF